jgi:AcrR family transcriptional regulator
MSSDYAGRGDLVRSLELLWGLREPPTRGPRPQLTVEQITEAAIALADAEGLDGFSMRRVAERLRVSTMSLYRYVPGKAELLDVMVDRVSGRIPRTAVDGAWRARLEQVARENRSLYERHPWLLQVFPGRPPLGPGVLTKYEHELACIEDMGLGDVELDLVLTVVLGYVRGATLSLGETAQVVERTGLTDHEWWAAMAPALERVFDPERFPLATRIGTAASEHYAGAHDPELAFEFGLQRVLDGVEALVAASRRDDTTDLGLSR